MRSFVVFLFVSAACAAPVDRDAPSTAVSDSSAASPPPEPSTVDEPKAAAPLDKQEVSRKHHGTRFPSGYYPPAVPYVVQPQPYYGHAAPHLVPKLVPIKAPVPVAAPVIQPVPVVVPAAQPVPVAVHAPAAPCAKPIKPAAPCQPHLIQRPPAPVISQQVVHRPVVTELQGIVRRPVYTEVVEVIHQPYYSEIQQAHKFPTHTLHIVQRPTYNVVQQEAVSAPIHLPGEQYHVVAPPQYVQQPCNAEAVRVPVINQAAAVPFAPQQFWPAATAATCRAGDDCVLEKAAAQPLYYYATSPYYNPNVDGRSQSSDAADDVAYTNADIADWYAAVVGEPDEVADNSSKTEPADQNAKDVTKMLARALASDESFVQTLSSKMDSISADLQRQRNEPSAADRNVKWTDLVNKMSDADRMILKQILEAKLGISNATAA